MQSEQVIELLSVIGYRIDCKDLNELSISLKYTRNAISKIESGKSELKEKLGTLTVSIEESIISLNTNSQNQSRPPHQEKPVETITINGEIYTSETVAMQSGQSRNKKSLFAGLEVSRATSVELRVILNNVLRNYNGSPSNLNITDHRKRMTWLNLRDSPICAFEYLNSNNKFIVMYDSSTGEFLIKKIALEKTVQEQALQMAQRILNSNSLGTETSEQADIPSQISNAIFKKLSNGLIEIDEEILNIYRTDSKSKKAVI